MIADSYLQLRRELENAVTGLLRLAGEMHRTPPWLDMLQSFLVEIREPLTVLVLGEEGVGKSTLLNALFESEFPSNTGVSIFRYEKEENVTEISPNVREFRLPLHFLRDFIVIDTPALSQLLTQDRQAISGWIGNADVIVLVFSVVQAWSQAAWQVFDVPDIATRNFVFVVQQSDLREPRELEIIRHNLDDVATQKLGFTPPIYTVSARDVLLTAKSGAQNLRPHLVEQFHALLQQITLVVTQSGGRTHKLRPACQLAQVVLHDIASGIRSSVDAIAHDETRVARAQTLLQARKQHTTETVATLLDDIASLARQRQTQQLAITRRKLSPLRLWTLLRSPAGFVARSQAHAEAEQRNAIAQKIDNTTRTLETEVRGLWPQLHDLVDQQLVTSAKDKVPPVSAVPRERHDLFSGIERMIEPTNHTEPAPITVAGFDPMLLWLRISTAVSAVAILAALTVLWLNATAARILGVVALVALATVVVLAMRHRARLLAAYKQRVESDAGELCRRIGTHLEGSLNSFYNSVAEAFRPLSEHCLGERQTWEPFLHRAEQLQRSLAEVASRLR